MQIVSFPVKELKKILYYHWTFNEYLKFKNEVETLRARLIGIEEVVLENNRLQKLLELKKNIVYSSVMANCIIRDPAHWNSAIVIDKGKKDGVYPGLPVVNVLGVIGKILEVSDHRAKVILINDPNFSVIALVQRSRESGLVSGTLQGMCRMRYLSKDADVQVGDQIVTSRLSSSFPEGLLIGEVIALELSQDDSTVSCILKPAVTLSQIEEVMIITQKQ